jgi:hypothetical protein
MMNDCLCGCGVWVGHWYKPGHDQKHMSKLLNSGYTLLEALRSLPSSAMRKRYARMYRQRVAKRITT